MPAVLLWGNPHFLSLRQLGLLTFQMFRIMAGMTPALHVSFGKWKTNKRKRLACYLSPTISRSVLFPFSFFFLSHLCVNQFTSLPQKRIQEPQSSRTHVSNFCFVNSGLSRCSVCALTRIFAAFGQLANDCSSVTSVFEEKETYSDTQTPS